MNILEVYSHQRNRAPKEKKENVYTIYLIDDKYKLLVLKYKNKRWEIIKIEENFQIDKDKIFTLLKSIQISHKKTLYLNDNRYQVRKDVDNAKRVLIVLKEDQGTSKRVLGIVKRSLGKQQRHPQGIKVELTSGEIGRVQGLI